MGFLLALTPVPLLKNATLTILLAMTWLPRQVLNLTEIVVQVGLKTAKTTAQKLFFACLIAVTCLITAILSYTLFLNLYLPTAEIWRPVHFSYQVCPSGHGICSFPSANVSFINIDGTHQEILGAGQHYNVRLELELPDTPVNRNLGMFQISIQMIERGGKIVGESQRSTMLQYRSLPLRILEQMLLWPFYLFNFIEQKQTLTVELFPNFVDSYYHPSIGANVQIKNNLVQLYSAKLKFMAGFTRLRYLMYYWPVTSAVCGVICNTAVIAAFFLVSVLKKSVYLSDMSEALVLKQDSSEKVSEESGFEIEEEKGLHENKMEDTSVMDTEKPIKDLQLYDHDQVYDLPNIHESDDHMQSEDKENLDFMSDLRHRRVN